jgi:gas vesicle protein
MAYRSDEYRNDDQGGAGFVLGLIAGAVVGAGLGMLFAPKSGAELRGQLSDQADELATMASRQYRRAAETANDLAERGRGYYQTARNAARTTANDVRDTANDMAEDISTSARNAYDAATEGRRS